MRHHNRKSWPDFLTVVSILALLTLLACSMGSALEIPLGSSGTSTGSGQEIPTGASGLSTGYAQEIPIDASAAHANWIQEYLANGIEGSTLIIEPAQENTFEISPVSVSTADNWVTISPFAASLSGQKTYVLAGYLSGNRNGATITVAGKRASDTDFSDITTIKPDENGLFIWAVPAGLKDVDLFRVTAQSGSDHAQSNAIRFITGNNTPVINPVVSPVVFSGRRFDCDSGSVSGSNTDSDPGPQRLRVAHQVRARLVLPSVPV